MIGPGDVCKVKVTAMLWKFTSKDLHGWEWIGQLSDSPPEIVLVITDRVGGDVRVLSSIGVGHISVRNLSLLGEK